MSPSCDPALSPTQSSLLAPPPPVNRSSTTNQNRFAHRIRIRACSGPPTQSGAQDRGKPLYKPQHAKNLSLTLSLYPPSPSPSSHSHLPSTGSRGRGWGRSWDRTKETLNFCRSVLFLANFYNYFYNPGPAFRSKFSAETPIF